jgi:hypothetical protein
MKDSYERKLNYMLEHFPYEICSQISFIFVIGQTAALN